MSTKPRSNVNDTDIAIVGISSILASGENLYESWESIRQGLDHVADLPADRVDITAYFNPDKAAKDQIYCKRGFQIPDYEIDPRDYGLNFNQVEDADANQLLTLLKVKEALSDAGIHPASKERKNVGVVLGLVGGAKASHEFYSRLNYVVMEKVLRKMGMTDEDVKVAIEKYKSQFPEWRVDSFPGFLGNVTAGRCCNVFNLDGMNCVVDAACASSLIALKVAIDEILFGDCETMVVGASCTDNSLGMYMAFSKTPVFSTDQGVSAYDEHTKGMLIGEGSVMLVIKRLSKALQDGDQVHAVIRGVASSSDGKTPGIYVPTVSGQELCIQRAWEKIGEPLNTCTLLEGHGTGTPVGDRIELTGMRNQFETHGKCLPESVAVGSIKSQVGHTKAVAGFAGLVKLVLALKHKVLPMSINVKNPPKYMDDTPLNQSALYINLKNRPWFVDPEIGIRRAGLSSFGFGGANYHMVVDEFESEHSTKPYRMHNLPLPVVLHASSSNELVAELTRIVQAVSGEARQAYDWLMQFRQENQVGTRVIPANHCRAGLLVGDDVKTFVSQMQELIRVVSAGVDTPVFRKSAVEGKVAALFSGQGSHYLDMFDDVAMNWPEFRQVVVDFDSVSKPTCHVRTSAVLYPRAPYASETGLRQKQENELNSVRNSQLAITATSVGCFNIFARAGMHVDVVGGHSLGEFAALHASGVVDAKHLAELICCRAQAMQTASESGERGKMVAVVGPNAEKTVVAQTEGVFVGNWNSPQQVVLTGRASAVDEECKIWAKAGFQLVPLNNTGAAFHSPQMSPAEREFFATLSTSKLAAPKIAWFNKMETAEQVKRHFSTHMTSPVKFTEQIRALYTDHKVRVFVEFGPGHVLSKLVHATLDASNNDFACVSVNPSGSKNSDLQLRQAALQCAILGVKFSHAFDPWQARNPFKGLKGFFNDVEATKKALESKTRVRMSAATYVSKKTIAERVRVLEDGRQFSCFANNQAVPASTQKAETQEELARLSDQLKQVQLEGKRSQEEAQLLKQKLEHAQDRRPNLEEINQRFRLEQLLQDYESLTKQLKALLLNGEGGGVASVSSPALVSTRKTPSVVATVTAPNVAVASFDRSQVEKVLKRVLSAQTGFDEQMLTGDLNLEDDLGVDSIKRVEFVSNVSAEFGISVDAGNMDKLARTRLVQEVVDVFVDIFAVSKGAAATSAPVRPVVAAAPAVSSSSSSAQFDRDQVIRILRQVLSEQTGFDEQLLSLDLNLEDDLGVDSIKRVEFVSNVSSRFNVTVKPEDMDLLARTRLVGEVVDVFCNHILETTSSSSSEKAAVKASPISSTTTTTSGLNRDQVCRILQRVLSEQTGFDEQMLSSDLNLEDDLGIDSIKRVEFVSNASAQLDIAVNPETMDKLARTRLVGEVLDVFCHAVLGEGTAAAPGKPVSHHAPSSSSSKTASLTREEITKVLQRVLSEQTGFDEQMLTLDLSLEDDLGVDSIKRVEFVSNVSSQLDITVKPETMDKLARTRTVGDVVQVMCQEIL